MHDWGCLVDLDQVPTDMQSVATSFYHADMMMLLLLTIMRLTGWLTIDLQDRPSLPGPKPSPFPSVQVAPLVLEPLPFPFNQLRHQSRHRPTNAVKPYPLAFLIVRLRQSS